MKWGVRHDRKTSARRSAKKAEQKAYQKKLGAAIKNRSTIESDRKRFENARKSLASRATKTAVSGVIQMLIGEAMSGNLPKYANMDKKQLAVALGKKAAMLTATTSANVAIDSALARSAAKRYDDSGKRKPGVRVSYLTREDKIQAGVHAATYGVTALAALAKVKVDTTRARRARDEERVNKWGANILAEKVDNVVWQSEDLSMAIIDNRS
jgi:hypothetical protein